jgi:hypothetical protein
MVRKVTMVVTFCKVILYFQGQSSLSDFMESSKGGMKATIKRKVRLKPNITWRITLLHEIMSRCSFCKNESIVGNALKLKWLRYKNIQQKNILHSIIILYEFHEFHFDLSQHMELLKYYKKSITILNIWVWIQ